MDEKTMLSRPRRLTSGRGGAACEFPSRLWPAWSPTGRPWPAWSPSTAGWATVRVGAEERHRCRQTPQPSVEPGAEAELHPAGVPLPAGGHPVGEGAQDGLDVADEPAFDLEDLGAHHAVRHPEGGVLPRPTDGPGMVEG